MTSKRNQIILRVIRTLKFPPFVCLFLSLCFGVYIFYVGIV